MGKCHMQRVFTFMANSGYSINGGPLIALEKMTQLKYQEDSQTLDIGPGNRWHDVAGYLEKYGRMVVSGRIGHVGVPGLLLGGKVFPKSIYDYLVL
jgi:FAD/FMN-containing dehydrogenase